MKTYGALAGIFLSLLCAAPLAAQSNLSVIPTAGYVMPGGKWVDDPNVTLEPRGGVFLGVSTELSLNKNLSVAGYVSRTLGATQKVELTVPSIPLAVESDIATTQLAAMLILRPLGRLPSGAPKTLYIEAGGGLNSYAVSRGLTDPDDPNALESFSYSTPAVMGGIGFAFPVGRRVTLQLFGRVNYQLSEYSSDFFDTITGITGEKTLLFNFGAGLRVGR